MLSLPTDPVFYMAAIPAVFLTGLSKGGFGGAFAMIAMPLLALVVPPLMAAAIMLPILIAMDIVSLWSWRGQYHLPTLRSLLPAALFGIGVGWATAAYVTDGAVRLIVGTLALVFSARWFWQYMCNKVKVSQPNPAKAGLWGSVAGFTSFVAHAGGPPFQMYVLPLRLDPGIYVGTSVIFFSIVNAVKLVPYFALGQFTTMNLAISAVLMPIAPVATLTGVWLVRRLKPETFYPFMYGMIALVGLKLFYDGLF